MNIWIFSENALSCDIVILYRTVIFKWHEGTLQVRVLVHDILKVVSNCWTLILWSDNQRVVGSRLRLISQFNCQCSFLRHLSMVTYCWGYSWGTGWWSGDGGWGVEGCFMHVETPG